MYLKRVAAGVHSAFHRVYTDLYHPDADKWTSDIQLTIGGTPKSVNGGSDVSWSRAEIGITKTYIDTLNINADLVDGLHATSFLRSDTADTAAGLITFSAGISLNHISAKGGAVLTIGAGEMGGNIKENLTGSEAEFL